MTVYIYSYSGSTILRMRSDGTVEDSHGSKIGRIRGGYIEDAHGSTIGRIYSSSIETPKGSFYISGNSIVKSGSTIAYIKSGYIEKHGSTVAKFSGTSDKKLIAALVITFTQLIVR